MLRYAVIGTSDITKQFIAGVNETGLWSLSAVYSRTMEKGSAFGGDYGVESVFTDLLEFAQSDLFDAVYVASPNYMHYEHCKVLLENGKHVICEKAFVSYLWQAQELFQIAQDNDLILMEAMVFMHHPNRKVIQDAISDLGTVTAAFFDNSRRSSKYDEYLAGELPNIFNPNLHAGGLMDMGVYSLYPALFFFGEPEVWHAEATMMERGADGLGSILLKYPDKVVNVRYSKISNCGAGSDIQSENGVIRIDSILELADVSFIDNQGKKILLGGSVSRTQVMAAEARDFYTFIMERSEHKEFYDECKNMTLMVCEYLEKCREKMGLPF